MQIDFSQFHPLDHSVLRCSGYHGGRRLHLKYWWEFKGRERVAVAWKHATGRHEWLAYARRDTVAGDWRYAVFCAGCDAEPDEATTARLIAEMKQRSLPDFKGDE